MKTVAKTIVAMALLATAAGAGAKEIWQDPTRFAVNRLPAEFDITPYLKDAANLLEVKVLKHCDGSGRRPHADDMIKKGEYVLSFLVEGL